MHNLALYNKVLLNFDNAILWVKVKRGRHGEAMTGSSYEEVTLADCKNTIY